MANALGIPDLRGNSAGTAGLALKYYPVYQQAKINGDTDLEFEQWLAQQMQPQGGQLNPQTSTSPNALSQ